MFATYDYSNIPVIKVILNGTIENDDDFNNFINEWKVLYEKEEDFEFEFDTKNAGLVNPKYCFYIALFIKDMKKRDKQYLKKSKIYVYNKYIFGLLKMIFSIQKPIAPIEIIYMDDNSNESKIEYISNE